MKVGNTNVTVDDHGDLIILRLRDTDADRLNTILLRHAVGLPDTAENRDFAADLSNAIERLRPRSLEGT